MGYLCLYWWNWTWVCLLFLSFFLLAGIISYYFMVWWLSWDVTLYRSSQIFLFGIGKGVSMHWFSTWEFQSLCITGCTRGCTLAIFSPIIIQCTMLLLWRTPLQVQTTKYQRQLFWHVSVCVRQFSAVSFVFYPFCLTFASPVKS